MKLISASFVCVTLCSAGVAGAQARIVPTDVKTAEKTDVEGWAPFLGVTGTINMVSNSHVVGQVDGFSTLAGIGITGGADFVKGKHLFRGSLTITESFARTPVIDEFVKTNDVVKLEGLYNYFLTKNLGLYGRLALSTSAFPADDVRGVPTTWVEKVPGGTPTTLKMDSYRQRLAGSFAPFTIDESAGGFAEPIRKEELNVSLRVGVGGRHTFASDVLLIDDDKATPEVELLGLSNVHQLGLELFAGATGKFSEGKTSYKAGLAVLFPFVNNDADDRSVTKLARVGFEGALTFNMYKWMSLVYALNITRDAQLFPAGDELLQVQNSLLLTFTFTVVKKPEKDKEPTEEEKALADAKQKQIEAEARAIEAERKLQELQPPPSPTPAPDATPTPQPAPTPAPAPAPTP